MQKELLTLGALAVGLGGGLLFTIPLAHGQAKPQTISVDEWIALTIVWEQAG